MAASKPVIRGIRTSISTTSGSRPRHQLDPLGSVGGLPDHLEVLLVGDQQAEPGPDHRLVVAMTTPWSTSSTSSARRWSDAAEGGGDLESAVGRRPVRAACRRTRATRSRIPVRPLPGPDRRRRGPAVGAPRRPACRGWLVRPSIAMREPGRMPQRVGQRLLDDPVGRHVQRAGTRSAASPTGPGSTAVPVARTWSTRSSSAASDGSGASASASAGRTSPTIRRSSSTDWRPRRSA